MRRKLSVVAVSMLVLAVAACDTTGLITNLRDGQIVPGPTITVSGQLPPDTQEGGILKVNGITTAVGPAPSFAWTQSVPADTANRVTMIDVVYSRLDGTELLRERRGVVNGPSVPEGQYSTDGVGMKFTNNGLTNLGPVIKDLAGSAFDIGGLLMAQNPVIRNADTGFLGYTADGYVKEAGIGGVDISAQSTATGVQTNITISDLYVGLDLYLHGIIDLACGLELKIPTTTIQAKFDLQPKPGDPSNVDVNMIGSPTVNTGTVGYEFISGVCDSDVFLIGSLVNSFAGPQIQSLVTSAFSSQLGDPDGAGPNDSPIADAIETALAEVKIAGPVGEAVHANLAAPLTSVTEGATGIDFRSNADFYTTIGTGPADCQPPAGAPDLAETFDVPGAPPTLGATTPSGQPYGVGLSISASAFNQLLSSMTECGLLNKEITEIPFGATSVPVTSAVLAGIAPGFAQLGNVPMKIKLRPTVGPFVTANAGPNGAMGELYLANLLLDFTENLGGYDVPRLTIAVDAPLALNLSYDAATNQLAPTISTAPGVRARVTFNPLDMNEAGLEAIFPQLFPAFVDGLSSSFAAFPLPSFLGLKIDLVQVARQGNYFVLYTNLTKVPQTRIENATLTDLSSSDTVTDSAFDVNEWRHRMRKSVGTTRFSNQYKGMAGADSCCAFADEDRSATAAYRMTFDVVPENGQSWRLDISQSIAGAHTIIDEDGGSATARFTTPQISGKARIGSGAWQSFNVTPSSSSRSSGGASPFTGSASTVLTGSTRQTITVEFSFGVDAFSDGGTFTAGDEAAVRFGANDTIANGFTAGEYPGIGNRNILTDGHFANVVLTPIG